MANKAQVNLKYHKGYGENFKFLRETYLIDGKPCTVRKLTEIFSNNGVGISHSTISNIENEQREPTVEQTQIYHDFFNVPFDYLTGELNTRKRETADICSYTGLSGASVEILSLLKSGGNIEYIDTINRIIESVNYKIGIAFGYEENTESAENNLFSALTWYLSSAFEKNTDKLSVTQSGKVKDYCSTDSEYITRAYSETNDLMPLFEINSGEIVEQVLLNKIIEELKKEKRG